MSHNIYAWITFHNKLAEVIACLWEVIDYSYRLSMKMCHMAKSIFLKVYVCSHFMMSEHDLGPLQ